MNLPVNILKSSPRAALPEIRAVLFDFDGTLAHLTIDFTHMRRLVLAELGAILGAEHPALGRDELPVMELIHAACAWAANAGQDDDAREIARRAEGAVSAYEVEMADPSALFPQTEILLRSLKRRGVKIAIVTRNCRAAVEKVFPHHAGLCDALVCRNDVGPEELKPRPGQLLKALELLACAPGKALMVGDHPMDILSGRAAGCLSGGVLTGNSGREAMQAAKPDWLAQDVAELFAKLELTK